MLRSLVATIFFSSETSANNGLRSVRSFQRRLFSSSSSPARPLLLQKFGDYEDFKERLRGLGDGTVRLELNPIDKRKPAAAVVATVTLDNPKRKNALSGKMMAELSDVVLDLDRRFYEKEPIVGVILRGVDGFCSGSDLNIIRTHLTTPTAGANMSAFMHATLLKFRCLPAFSIAAIQGPAVGGGSELAALCDYRVMSKESTIGFVHITLGVSPGWGGATWLRELLGTTAMMKILAQGRVYGAAEALQVGLVDKIANEGETIEETAIHLLKELHSYPKTSEEKHNFQSVQGVKELAYSPETVNRLEKELAHERKIFTHLWASEHHMKAIAPKKETKETIGKKRNAS